MISGQGALRVGGALLLGAGLVLAGASIGGGGDGGSATTLPAAAVSTTSSATTTTGIMDGGPSVSTESIPTVTTVDLADETTDRLTEAGKTTGLAVLAPEDPAWRLVGLDASVTDGGAYVAASYERADDYFTITQERGTGYVEMPAYAPVTVRTYQGQLLDLSTVVVIRWLEGGGSVTVSTNLPRKAALRLIEDLRTPPTRPAQ